MTANVSTYFTTPEPHWYLVSTVLSRFGYEISLRVPGEEWPEWADVALSRLAGFLQIKHERIEAGQVMNLGPMLAPYNTQLAGVWFVNDPAGQPDGSALFQAVGVTAAELQAISTGYSDMVGTLLLERSPLYLTELDRDSVVTYP